MHTPSHFLLTIFSLIKVAVSEEGICSMPPSIINSDSDSKPLYWKVTNPTLSPSHLQDLPGFTRSVYKRDHALITPESQVFSPLPEWTNTLGAYLITPAIGSNFVMYLAKMQGLPMGAKWKDRAIWNPIIEKVERRISNDKKAYVADLMQFPNGVLFWDLEFLREIHDRELDSLSVFWNVIYGASLRGNSKSGLPPSDVERFIFVVQGAVTLANVSGVSHELIHKCWRGDQPLRVVFLVLYDSATDRDMSLESLLVDSYAYLPPNFQHSLKCDASATLVVFERRYASLEKYVTEQIVSSTEKQPLLETPGEIFELRKLLPTSLPYDFNIHIMDFQPGEFLNVKEVHYNQHGLLLLEGQGVYRLGDSWYPVEAGDVIWMAPFVPQWYAALGKTRTRYLLYKDVNRDPL
uniref:Cupin type-2 domain-containing protein n=1 Tax=Quercus lobata TaxID=97700 RepID=A0A7N2N2N6_QUELO